MDDSVNDLTQAETDLATAVAASTAATNAATQEIGNLTAQITANPGDAVAVEAAAKAIEAQVATINQNTAALAGNATGNTTGAEIAISPESFVATAGSNLNDVIQGSGGVGVISFSGVAQNGLTVNDTGNSTAVIGGVAPFAGGNATIDVSYADQGSPPQEGTVTITVAGV
jgi:hypothetical protein